VDGQPVFTHATAVADFAMFAIRGPVQVTDFGKCFSSDFSSPPKHADALLIAAAVGAVDRLVNVALELGDEQVVNRFARFASTAIDAFDPVADMAVVMLLRRTQRTLL
jgi:hypothetical protein